MRGPPHNRRLRYLTHPLVAADPPIVPHYDSNLLPVNPNTGSTDNVYTNIALGECIENLMYSNPNQEIISEPVIHQGATPLCPITMCHHKSVQNLIREERAISPVSPGIPIPQARIGYRGSNEDLVGTASGRSSPAATSYSTPNSPPKYLTTSSSLYNERRAPSPLLQVAHACENRCEKNMFVCWFFLVYV